MVAPADSYEMAGMSGSFVATLLDRNGVIYWQPAAVAYEFSTDLQMFMAARLDRIEADGRILR